MEKNILNNISKLNIFQIVREIFYFLLLTLISLFILELVYPGSVLAYFNLNLLLLICLAVAILLVYWPENKRA
jgi:hypothetical protein